MGLTTKFTICANLLTELDLTRIEVLNIDSGWHAGQHMQVRRLTNSLGWFGWSEMYPFTIASVSALDTLIGSNIC